MVLKQKFKLQYHPRIDSRGFLSEDVIISSRGSHSITVGDVVEVYHAEDIHHALFLVTHLSDELQNRDVISVEQSLAHTFKLQQHKSVIVNVISKETVSLDLVELYFRDQYFSRRDFYNITRKLVGTVVHVNKKLTCNEMRTQVGDLWRLGEKYSCGYVDSKTKIIFRSSTAVIHIFIQMSQEMWWFDNNGDLHLEKAFKFLSKLFLRFWPENNCNHDTTVVFFTRIYIDDLPSAYTQSFKQDVQGRFYEDFYRVIIQNERFTTDEWKRELGRMQYEVIEFEKHIYSYLYNAYPLMNENSNQKTKLNICTAMDANLLEVLNMAINLYSGYNVDRNFDRTGKLLFVITPGSGVYHVNENLLMLTKKRVLDLGVGVDLICLAEQPLHAVPLFKILSESFINPEEYIAPHWINCSYFKSAQELRYIEMGKPFPRVKVVSFKDSDDFLLSKNTEEIQPINGGGGHLENHNEELSGECHDKNSTQTTLITTTTTTKSSLPIYRIVYPFCQVPSLFNNNNNTLHNRIKYNKIHPSMTNELFNESLAKSNDSIITTRLTSSTATTTISTSTTTTLNDYTSSTLNDNRLRRTNPTSTSSSSTSSLIIDPSVNCSTTLSAINTVIAVAKARRASICSASSTTSSSASSSLHKMTLSLSNESEDVTSAITTTATIPSSIGGLLVPSLGGSRHIDDARINGSSRGGVDRRRHHRQQQQQQRYHTGSLDRWQYCSTGDNYLAYSSPPLVPPASSSLSGNLMYSEKKSLTLPNTHSISHLQNSLSRVTSKNHITNPNNNGTTGNFTNISSLPSVRERCAENNQTSDGLIISKILIMNNANNVSSLPVLSRHSRIRTQSFSGEQKSRLCCIDSSLKEVHNSLMNTGRRDSVEGVCQQECNLSHSRTMDVVMSDGQHTNLSASSSPWSVANYHQSSGLRGYNSSKNRRTGYAGGNGSGGILSLSGPSCQTPLPLGNIARRKSTMTLYPTVNSAAGAGAATTPTNTTPLHSIGKHTTTTNQQFYYYTRNSTSYAASSLISGSYFPFGLGSNSSRIPISAGQRRWALVRPSDEYGSTITPHCIITSSDDIDIMFPTPLPYNLCEIWVAYFNFLRAYLQEKSAAKDSTQMGNSNLCSLKDITTNTTNNNSNINGIVNHSTSDSLQQQFGLRKAKVSMSLKCLPNYDERPSENLNVPHNCISSSRLPPASLLSSSQGVSSAPRSSHSDENSKQCNPINNNNVTPAKTDICINNQPTGSSVLQQQQQQQHHQDQQISVMHDRSENLSDLSENSLKALQLLLEAVKSTMLSFSSTGNVSTNYLSSVATLATLSSTLIPQSAYFYPRKGQHFLSTNGGSTVSTNSSTTITTTTTTNANNNTSSNSNNNHNINSNNNSTDDQNLYGVHLNNYNNLYHKHAVPKRIGVDWKSLIVPACLPVDTDYFPDTNRLRSEWYILHDYRVVPSGMSLDEWMSINNDDLEPGAYYNHRQLTAREVFQEMVLQRISQGFQLCHEAVQQQQQQQQQHNPTNSNPVEHHQHHHSPAAAVASTATATTTNTTSSTTTTNGNNSGSSISGGSGSSSTSGNTSSTNTTTSGSISQTSNPNHANINSNNNNNTNNKSQHKSVIKQNAERRDQRNSSHTTTNNNNSSSSNNITRKLTNNPIITTNTPTPTTTAMTTIASSIAAVNMNTNIKRFNHLSTHRNPTSSLMKPSHRYPHHHHHQQHQPRLSSPKMNSSNTTNNVSSSSISTTNSSVSQCFKSSCGGGGGGRILGVGLTINRSGGNQSTNSSSTVTSTSGSSSSSASGGGAGGRGAGVGGVGVSGTISGSTIMTTSIGGRYLQSMHKVHNNNNNRNNNNTMTKSTLGTISKFGDTDQGVKTACKLSIGHLFHLISLDEDSIAVTSYRQIDKIIKIAYSYALQVPDAKSYVSLNTNFTNDSTVILNWNYLDNYLCNRGISDSFRLLPNLKFWRSRFFILPIYSNETRRLTEAIRDNTTGSRIPCDVFESDYANMNREKTCERFVHFIESVNRIRRTVIPSRKINRQSAVDKPDAYRTSTCNLPSSNTLSDSSMPSTPISCVTGSQKLNKTGSLTTSSSSTTTTIHTIRSSTIASSSIIGLGNESNESSNNTNTVQQHTGTGTTAGGNMMNQTNVTPIDDCQSTTSLPNLLGIFYQSSEDQSSQPSQPSFGNMSVVNNNMRSSFNSVTTPYSIVAFMMADNENGLPFILASTTNAFPDYTFISIDAVNWVIKWFVDIGTIEQAVIYLQQWIEAGWLCHTSGNPKHAFIYGTYFYTLLIPDLKQSGSCAPNELPINLSTSDSNELSITHSAPVTPVQSNASLSATSTTPTTNVNYFAGSITATNTMACCSTSTTHSCSVHSSNTGSSLSTISSSSSSSSTTSTATTTTGNINSANTSVTTTNNHCISSNSNSSTASIISSTLLNPSGVSNISSIASFVNQSHVDVNLQPSAFPKGYIPKLSNDSTKWTCVFQNEWAEIAIVYYDGTDGQLSRQQIRGDKTANMNDSPSTTDTTPPPPATTTTTTSTTTTTATMNSSQTNDSSLSPLPSSSSSSCSTPRIQCKTLTEKDCFIKDGLLKYSLISSLFGIPDKTGFQEIDQILRKSCLCDMDEPDDDGRVEWAHCVYDANYHPTCAFSIELQWLVVTGGRMAELVSLWHQKAGAANLHFFPVPCFPFNQSDNDFLSDKDPLRKPIFLPININVLIETVETSLYSTENLLLKCKAKGVNNCSDMNLIDVLEYLFPDIPYAERLTCIRCFQDSILRRFGFISDNCDKDRLNYELHGRRAFISCNSPKQWIYVHCSGGIFAMIPLYESFEQLQQSEETLVDNTDTLETLNSHSTEGTTDNMTAHNFKDDQKTPTTTRTSTTTTTTTSTATTGKNVTETLSDRSTNCYLLQTSLGYFWAWNHMLPRRWRGHLTGDESFQDGMLADFRAFVNGEDNRLSQYFSQFIKSLTN